MDYGCGLGVNIIIICKDGRLWQYCFSDGRKMYARTVVSQSIVAYPGTDFEISAPCNLHVT